MVLQTTGKIIPTFTLGSKLDQLESKPAEQYRHPLMADFAAYVKSNPAPFVPRVHEAYPGLGRPMARLPPGADPPVPVSGPSQPQCGMRATDFDSDKFVGLSPEMATYNFNRTTAIMAGARPGC